MEIMRWKIVDTARQAQWVRNTKHKRLKPKPQKTKYKNTQRHKSEWKPSDGNNEMKDTARPA